jgi:hypothetical protein
LDGFGSVPAACPDNRKPRFHNASTASKKAQHSSRYAYGILDVLVRIPRRPIQDKHIAQFRLHHDVLDLVGTEQRSSKDLAPGHGGGETG